MDGHKIIHALFLLSFNQCRKYNNTPSFSIDIGKLYFLFCFSVQSWQGFVKFINYFSERNFVYNCLLVF